MPRAGYLAQLGWFVVNGFLDAAACAAMRREMQSAPSDRARVLDGENRLSVDAELRRTEVALVSPQTRAWVTDRFMAIRPSLERHFELALAGCEPPSFLVYREGFYYGRHVDANPNPAAPASFQKRRVSISVFLNAEGDEKTSDTYHGGSLAFYGSVSDDPNAAGAAIVLTGEEGLLVGFRSHWPHEVRRVQRGVRYSIVTWFA